MAMRRQAPAPREWLNGLPGRAAQWVERLTRNVPITGRVDVTIDPTTVSANSTSEQTFTVTGARDGDAVIVTKPSHSSGLGIVNARVSGTDTVAITFMNATGSGINPPSEEYRVWLVRWSEG